MAYLTLLERLRIPTYDNRSYATAGRVTIDDEKCTGCGTCVFICPGRALFLSGSGKEKKARLEEDFPHCMSCNDCAAACKRGAVKVSKGYDFGYYFKAVARGELTWPRTFDAL
ncbi:MAG TPA: 4Fe-4S dicluster domain-containing protein [Deltaproteobacteria bacterium]|jgi:formate hydrogenlyase subunit 6/NADH:ubiquinone oxidoreductase subunit I|nr:4Fe-4S dicluster domain-containing protein [Deltaproteobacteria bacterium]HOI05736.1 4Fe-4S dicluster domain-containing protein [Deltaproteobacteria bacterium]